MGYELRLMIGTLHSYGEKKENKTFYCDAFFDMGKPDYNKKLYDLTQKVEYCVTSKTKIYLPFGKTYRGTDNYGLRPRIVPLDEIVEAIKEEFLEYDYWWAYESFLNTLKAYQKYNSKHEHPDFEVAVIVDGH